jgi:hypothetical protein
MEGEGRVMSARTGSNKSGWCSGPPGSIPPHKECRAAVCGCHCHTEEGS